LHVIRPFQPLEINPPIRQIHLGSVAYHRMFARWARARWHMAHRIGDNPRISKRAGHPAESGYHGQMERAVRDTGTDGGQRAASCHRAGFEGRAEPRRRGGI